MKHINPASDVNAYFTKIPNFLLSNKIKLTDLQRSFYFYIWGKIISSNGYAEISLSDVNRDLGYSKSKTIRLRNELITCGLIFVNSTKNRHGGCGKTRYYLTDLTDTVENSTPDTRSKFETPVKQKDNKQGNSINKLQQTDTHNYESKNIKNPIEIDFPQRNFSFDLAKNEKEDVVVEQNICDIVLDDENLPSPEEIHTELLNRDVCKNTADKILREVDIETIKLYIKYADWQFSKGKVLNLGAFLSTSILKRFDLKAFKVHLEKKKEKATIYKEIQERQTAMLESEKAVEKEHIEMEQAENYYQNLCCEKQKILDEKINLLIDKRFDSPTIGRKAFRKIVLRQIYSEINLSEKSKDVA